jgi:hypothetical protein
MTKQIIAALALAFGTTVAFAADTAAEKKQPAEQPATKAMDKAAGPQAEQDKAVRESKEAVDKSKQVGTKEKSKEPTAGKEPEQAAAGKPGEGRNWGNIDKDKNNLVSAEEMEAWLKANPGPLAGSAGKEAPAGKEPPASKEAPPSKEPGAEKEKKQ